MNIEETLKPKLKYEKYELDFIHDRLNDMAFNWEKVSGSSIDWLFIDFI